MLETNVGPHWSDARKCGIVAAEDRGELTIHYMAPVRADVNGLEDVRVRGVLVRVWVRMLVGVLVRVLVQAERLEV